MFLLERESIYVNQILVYNSSLVGTVIDGSVL